MKLKLTDPQVQFVLKWLNHLDRPNLNRIFQLHGGEWEDFTELVSPLLKSGFIRSKGRRNPGRKPYKEYSWEEHRRAERGFWYDDGTLSPSTMRRYGTVLGQNRKYMSHIYTQYRFDTAKLFALFESLWGLPTGVNATEFAKTVGVPARYIKAWFRALLKRGAIFRKKIRGRRFVVTCLRQGGLFLRKGAALFLNRPKKSFLSLPTERKNSVTRPFPGLKRGYNGLSSQ
jgi:hypothetical protein